MGNVLKLFGVSSSKERTYSIAAVPGGEYFGGKRKRMQHSMKNNRSKKNKTRRH
jgi:hypothetical protein